MSVQLLRILSGIFSICLICYMGYFHMSNYMYVYTSYSISLFLLAFIDGSRKSTYPILMFYFIYQTTWTLLGYMLVGRNDVFFLLLYGLNDFLFMFALIKFYKSISIQRFFGVKGDNFHFPQLQWIAGFIALSCFFKLAAFSELMIHKYNPDFFQDFIPFFFINGQVATGGIRVIIEVLLWILVLQSINLKANTHKFMN